MHSYETVTEALNDLNKRGFTNSFNVKAEGIECGELNLLLLPDDFEIKEVYRFEGNSNPDDEEIIYAIQSKDGAKGVIVDAFGPYAGDISEELLKKFRTNISF